jgi:hypothetical protein
MSWLWLGLLVLVGAGLWLLRRRRLRDDAVLQESLDHLGPHAEPKRPPAKQPWHRPGFGPAPRMSALDLGSGPLPPAAGGSENPDVAGPMPDDEDVPALIPVDMSDEVESDDEPSAKPPVPPPPPPPAASEDGAIEDPARDPAAATIEELDPITDDYDADDVEAALRRGPRVIDLPTELADEVRELMGRRQEVAAVRLICDSMGVGILDAQRTVRSLTGR